MAAAFAELNRGLFPSHVVAAVVCVHGSDGRPLDMEIMMPGHHNYEILADSERKEIVDKCMASAHAFLNMGRKVDKAYMASLVISELGEPPNK